MTANARTEVVAGMKRQRVINPMPIITTNVSALARRYEETMNNVAVNATAM